MNYLFVDFRPPRVSVHFWLLSFHMRAYKYMSSTRNECDQHRLYICSKKLIGIVFIYLHTQMFLSLFYSDIHLFFSSLFPKYTY